MRHLATVISDFEIACLETEHASFYARLGWEVWRGPLAGRKAGELLFPLVGGLARPNLSLPLLLQSHDGQTAEVDLHGASLIVEPFLSQGTSGSSGNYVDVES
jgi:hypothetical protein